jgi:hypothetical protein
MNNFVADLIQRMQGRIGNRRRALISILPLRESPSSERLPWEPSRIELAPQEVLLLAALWRELHQEFTHGGVMSEFDILHFALQELQLKIQSGRRQDVLLRLGFHLCNERQ